MSDQIKPNYNNYRDTLSTVDEKGKRVWLYPKMPSGKWFNKRQFLGYALLLFLILAPFIQLNSEPIILFNIIERKFVLFGKVFWPQDFYIFAIAMVTGLVFIILFTLVFGRLFCGWACPQTIFMELIFRRIEYWIEGDWKHQQKLNKEPWGLKKATKKISKHLLFWFASFFIANIFLLYIIGYKELFSIIIDDPANHIGGLSSIIIFTSLFYGVFAFMREQVCTTICPYGRLQGVLLDKDSLVVSYDYKRGENRGKIKKNEDRSSTGKGDCIDCKQCVYVCPTGIDIRNGTQLECVNCTACMDACDHMMEAVNLKKGLIRYASENSIQTGSKFKFTVKAKAYMVVLILLIGLLTTLVVTRANWDMTIKRTKGGTLYYELDNNIISNIFDVIVINKTNTTAQLEFKVVSGDASVELVGHNDSIKGQDTYKSSIMVKMKEENIHDLKTPITIGVFKDGKLLETEKVHFVGPLI